MLIVFLNIERTEMHVKHHRFIVELLTYFTIYDNKNLDSPEVITERETTKGDKESSRPNVPVHHPFARRRLQLTSLIPRPSIYKTLRHDHAPFSGFAYAHASSWARVHFTRLSYSLRSQCGTYKLHTYTPRLHLG